MQDSDYVPYAAIAERLAIAPGDILVVSSDVLRIAIACRDEGERFDANRFIDSLLARVGPGGTVLFPTFTWEFCKTGRFDVRETPSLMGALTNAALKRPDFRRTRHALYSFAVWGARQAELCALDNMSSWSEDSPFGWLVRAGARNLFVGIDYKLAFTFDHYAEQKVGVDYRYHKIFRGEYVDYDRRARQAEFSMYVRDLARNIVTYISPRLDAELAAAGLYRTWSVNGVYFGMIDLAGASAIMEDDLRRKGGLIYTAAPAASAAA